MVPDYADNKALLANTSTQAESQLHILEQAAGDIGLFLNANKTEQMCFNREGTVSTLNGVLLKWVDKFTYSSTESDSNIHLVKAWAAIDRLSIMWKSDLSDKIKLSSKQQLCQYYCMDALYDCWQNALRKN